jgi:hypothetical protein
MDDCTLCGGLGWLTRDDVTYDCRCTRVRRARQYLDRHPALRGVRTASDLCDMTPAGARPKRGHRAIQAPWDVFLRNLAGWMASCALLEKTPWQPRVWIASEVDIRQRHFADTSGTSKSPLADYDLIVIRVSRTKHGGTSEAVFDLVHEVHTSAMPVTIWIVTDVAFDLNHQKLTVEGKATLDAAGFVSEVLS